MTEFAYDRPECVSRRRKPIFMARPTLPGPAFDDSVKLQVAQPRDQYRARYQRYAAMEIVEGADIGHQLAQDQRHPALGENFRRLRDRAELVIPAVHAGH